MKKKIFLGILLVSVIMGISFWAKSQASTSTDALNFVDFDMSPTGMGYTPFNIALLGESGFISRFGAPSAGATADYSDEHESNMNHYVYAGAEAWYLNDDLQALAFTTPDFSFVRSNGSTLKVGDAISAVASMFPSSWTSRTGNQVYIELQNSQGPVDMTLMFEYDLATGLITTISIQQ